MKLEVSGLTKCYGKTRALDGLTLPVEIARVLVLIGPSGGGKSTLLRVLGGLETASGGRTRRGVVVRADNVRRLTADGWQAALDHEQPL